MNYTYYRRYQPSKRKNNSFRSFFWLVIFMVCVLLVLRACISVASEMLAEKKDEATFTLYKGEAEILEWGQSEPKPASDAQLLLEGDQVSTGENSWATLTFYDGTEIHLDQKTQILLTEVKIEPEGEQVLLQLLAGRVWVSHAPQEDQQFDLGLRTALLDVQSLQGEYLLAQQGEQQAVFVQAGPVTLEYMDRSGSEDRVIETAVLSDGEMSLLDLDTQTALLARENVTLVQKTSAATFSDAFVQWSTDGALGEHLPEEEPVEDEEVFDEENLDDMAENSPEASEISSELVIRVLSPASGSTIPKGAIALEGEVVSGTASRVTVTWSGNGAPYTLSGFTPGSLAFRYVADADYGNYTRGANTYTVVAYDESGQASNSVVVTLNAEF